MNDPGAVIPFCDYVVINNVTGLTYWLDSHGRVFTHRSAYLFMTKMNNDSGGVECSVFSRVSFKESW